MNCPFCNSEKVEKITEQYGAGFTKEVFQVTWKNTDTGKEESTRVMAFDKADAKKEAKRSNREITKVEGPIMEEPRKEEAKVPFDQRLQEDVKVGDVVSIEDLEDNELVPASKVTSVRDDIWRTDTYQVIKTEKGDKEYHGASHLFVKESKLHETVRELVGETPGIDKDEQKILFQAIEKGTISNEWPSEEEIVDALVKAEIDPHIVDDADMGELRQIYLKHVLLTQAVKLTKVASESKLSEQEVYDKCPKCGSSELSSQQEGGETSSWKTHQWCEKCGWDNYQSEESKLSEQEVVDVLTRVLVDGKPITGWIKNKDAKTIALMLKKAGMSDEKRTTFEFEKDKSESKFNEQEVEGVPEKGRTYHILQKLGTGLPEGNYEVTDVEYRRTVKGDLAKHFQVVGDDNWWIAKFYGFKEVASESKINEEEDWDLTFQYRHNLIWHNPLRDKIGNPYIWQKHSISGKRIRVFSDYQANWVEKNKGTPVRGEVEEAKEIKPSTAIEIVRSGIDPDAYNIQAVELPKGDTVVLTTLEGTPKEVRKKGKEVARSLGAEFLGIIDEKKIEEGRGEEIYQEAFEYAKGEILKQMKDKHTYDEFDIRKQLVTEFGISEKEAEDIIYGAAGYDELDLGDQPSFESKLKEQEEDTFKTIAKGIAAKTLADEIADKRNGVVVKDEDDENKFMIIAKEE